MTARRRAPAAPLLWLALAAGCGGEPVGPEPEPATATLVVRADLSQTSATVLVVEVTAPDIPTPLVFNLGVSNGVASGTITVTAGSDRTVTLRAFDAEGVETHRGYRTITVYEGTNPAVTITLAPLVGGVAITVTLEGVTVAITPELDTVVAGGLTAQLAASVTTASGDPLAAQVQWATLDPGIATVDAAGVVTGRSAGTARIVATYAGVGAAAAVLVLAPEQVPPALQLLAEELSSPVLVTAPPADTSRLFVVLQVGQIRVVRGGTLLPAPFLDVAALISGGGERGLLGLAFHPHYAANGLFFVNYTDADGHTVVARYQVSADPDVANPASATTVLTQEQPFSNHNGGMLAFGPDGYLYIGLGDGGSGGDPQHNAQTMTTLLGKMLRIDVDGAPPYAVPASNPFVGVGGGVREEIWASGLRNPWRYGFDRATGDLYIGDVGQSAREEVNVQPAGSAGGENYGWNVMEGSICYNASSCSTEGLTLPVLDYVNPTDGCSITGGYVYRGTQVPILAGRYLYADYCRGWVRSFTYAGGAATDPREWTALAPGGTISSFGEDARGELYVVAHNTGAVYRIVPALR